VGIADLIPHSRRRLAFALVLAGCGAAHWATTDILLDDTFIYLRVANNWLAGHGPRFNPGDQHMPITGAGWLMVLTACHALAPALSFVTIAKAAAFLCMVGSCIVLHLLLAERLPVASILAPIPVFFAPWAEALAGHDTALALFAGLLLIYAIDARRMVLAPLAGAIFYLARAEGAVFAGVAIAVAAVRTYMHGTRRGSDLRSLLVGSALAAIVIGVWQTYYASEFGALLPSTLHAKRLQAQSYWQPFAAGLGPHAREVVGSMLLAPLALVGGWRLVRAVPLIPAWATIHFAALAALGVADYFWYFYPVDFTLMLALVIGIAWVMGALAYLLQPRIGGLAAWACSVFMVGAAGWLIEPIRLASEARVATRNWRVEALVTRRTAYGQIADYVSGRSLARIGPWQTSMLADEIGLFGFLLPEVRVFDTVGLAVPIDSPSQFYDWAAFAARLAPDVLVLPDTRDVRAFVVPESDGRFTVYGRTFRPATSYSDGSVFERGFASSDAEQRRLEGLVRLGGNPVSVLQPLRIEVRDGIGPVLLSPAPSAYALEPKDQERSLDLAFGFQPGPADQPADEVQFEVVAVSEGEKTEVIWSRKLHPGEACCDGAASVRIDLPNRNLEGLRLVTHPVATKGWSSTYWSEATLH